MSRGSTAWPALLALASGACASSCGRPPPAAAPSRADPVAGLAGVVEVRGPDRRPLELGPVEVRFVPEAEMRPFVQARVEQALAELARLRAEGERLRAEVDALRAENDRLNQRWRQNMDRDLRRRLELQVSRDLGAGEVRSAQEALVQRKRRVWAEARDAARRADAAEREWLELLRAVPRIREAAFFVEGLPPPAGVATTDAAGRFQARLPAGRYAIVARAGSARSGGAGPAWLLWADVAPGAATPLALTESNLHGTDCPACVVTVGALAR